MTNKTICHGNNVNNNSPSKSALNKAQSSSTTSTSTSTSITTTTSSKSNGKSNNTSNPSQINNNNNNNNSSSNKNNIKLCPEGGYNNVAMAEGNGGSGIRVVGGGIIKAYAHGIWYQEYDTIDNSVQQQIQHLQQQRQRLYQHNVKGWGGGGGVADATNASGYVLHPENDEMRRSREQQQQQHKRINGKTGSSSTTTTNNNINANQQSNCDIVIVDIEDEPYQATASPPPPNRTNKPTATATATATQPPISTSSYLINESLSLRNSKQNLLDETIIERQVKVAHVATGSDNYVGGRGKEGDADVDGTNGPNADDIGDEDDDEDDDDVDDVDDDDDDDIDDEDSLASMETLSDNVSIWIDGEKHWIAGVDGQTTCADLVWALLNYQNGQPEHRLNTNTMAQDNDVKHNAHTGVHKELHRTSYTWDNRYGFASPAKPVGNGSSQAASSISTHSVANNQSMPINTKEEHFKITRNLSRTVSITARTTTTTTTTSSTTRTMAGCNDTALPRSGVTALPLPPGITTPAQLATEYVIVKQYLHCEEYLDGSAKVFDVLPPRDSQHKKECELLLRRLGPAPPPTSAYANNTTPQLSSLISTDKDSGMGSPVGSARSAKFRRRKHKSSQWLAQANTLHPRMSRCTATANERLLKIILAQDETIQRQLFLLREKERQINKIEEEKHRKRERELGKNYLLETYLNGLDEAECEPEQQDGEEIFIDEAYQHLSATSPIQLPSSTTSLATQKTATTTTTTTTTHFDVETITLDNNFKPKDIKKEKKKKRHKDKTTAKDEDAKKHSAASVNMKAKEKSQEILHQQRQLNNEMTNIPGSVLLNADANDGAAIGSANKAETEMQIYWLEKVYTLNKQLHKEEELAAKLHAKIRRHQLKKANQTQKEVQLEIDKLGNCLAVQCSDIRRVEANLMETNDQLQKKLLVLERLSLDYIRQQEGEAQTDEHQQNQENENCIRAEVTKPTPPKLLKESGEIQQLSLSNIRSAEEVEKLQKLIAKPSLDMHATNEMEQHHHSTTTTSSIYAHLANIESHMLADYPENNDRQLLSANCNSKASLSAALIADQRMMPVKACQTPSATLRLTAATPPAVEALTAPMPSAATPSCFVSQAPAVVLDKNMLSSLHVQNAKTIKKQMFHSQTVGASAPHAYTTATAMLMSIAPTSASASVPSPSPSPSPASTPTPTPPTALVLTAEICPKASEINALPLQQYDQNVSPHMLLPLAASSTPALITLGPHNSHQLQPQHHHQTPSVFMVNRPPAVGVASLAPIQATIAVATAAAAAAATLSSSSASSSSSSPASLMAMNTVDISQLGTLV